MSSYRQFWVTLITFVLFLLMIDGVVTDHAVRSAWFGFLSGGYATLALMNWRNNGHTR